MANLRDKYVVQLYYYILQKELYCSNILSDVKIIKLIIDASKCMDPLSVILSWMNYTYILQTIHKNTFSKSNGSKNNLWKAVVFNRIVTFPGRMRKPVSLLGYCS